jgi:hypothetical protein
MTETTSKNAVAAVHASPKDVFIHLLMIGTLYVGVFSFCSLWYDYINLLFPDKLNFYYRSILDGVLTSTSILIVIFPVYIFTSWLLEKDIALVPEKRELRVRKWLVYLTLFIAAIAIIVEVVRLIYNFQMGELTMNFSLKIVVTLLVAAAAFGYHLWDVKRPIGSVSMWPKNIAIAALIVVFGSVGYSYVLVGTPSHQRAVRFDDQRISDLQNVQGQIIAHWQQKEKLPATLAEMNDSISGFVPPTDPDTGAPYEYSVKSPLSFELCATFGAKSINDFGVNRDVYEPMAYYDKATAKDNWSHEAGRTCFERTIDPEFYKINKPIDVNVLNAKEAEAKYLNQ